MANVSQINRKVLADLCNGYYSSSSDVQDRYFYDIDIAITEYRKNPDLTRCIRQIFNGIVSSMVSLVSAEECSIIYNFTQSFCYQLYAFLDQKVGIQPDKLDKVIEGIMECEDPQQVLHSLKMLHHENRLTKDAFHNLLGQDLSLPAIAQALSFATISEQAESIQVVISTGNQYVFTQLIEGYTEYSLNPNWLKEIPLDLKQAIESYKITDGNDKAATALMHAFYVSRSLVNYENLIHSPHLFSGFVNSFLFSSYKLLQQNNLMNSAEADSNTRDLLTYPFPEPFFYGLSRLAQSKLLTQRNFNTLVKDKSLQEALDLILYHDVLTRPLVAASSSYSPVFFDTLSGSRHERPEEQKAFDHPESGAKNSSQ